MPNHQMPNHQKPKIIVILGPTSSGKSSLAIRLAKKFNGEIISADSRQIYRGMDIGTGKTTGAMRPVVLSARLPARQEAKDLIIKKLFISEGIIHYGIDITSPKTEYNAAKFKKYAEKSIREILKKGKLPIICGGTGFWIKAVVDDIDYPEVKPDWDLRNNLCNKSVSQLFKMLKKLDPARAKTIDKYNPARLTRAIEICKTLGEVPCEKKEAKNKKYAFLQIGINLPKDKLHKNIKKRLKERFGAGMIEEVEKLHREDKISWKRLESFGLGYKVISQYLREKVHPVKFERSETGEAVFNRVYLAEKNYAKRQMTWFKKDKRIIWLEKYKEIEKEVRKFTC